MPNDRPCPFLETDESFLPRCVSYQTCYSHRRKHPCICIDDCLPSSPKVPLLVSLDIIDVLNAYSSSSSSSFLIGFDWSICAPTLPVNVSDKPSPKRCRIASSSRPETLALARFKGLPTVPLSKALEDPRSNLAFGNSVGGVVARFDTCGGVEPAVGVFDAGDFRVAGVLEFRGSAECWRFSCYDRQCCAINQRQC